MSGNLTVYLFVKGKVQNVMFRQTIMRGSISRGVVAGATNNRQDRQRVDITLEGPEDKVNEIIEGLRSGKKLNSWGAHCTSVEILTSGKKPLEHEVNTSNVDNIKWKKGVEFYL
ncbi:Acylphosphatase family protein [Histomonas meleagridis]|uniref:Acylphosphatase family protein n=1 Tax=Histomonas meleagridis TaxID=135588 RepID=UPI003559D0B6|nr:Acylphosphatase family protein [Histomonas meleagridis]KAH0796145.1 Acylphosphatase family protein [Histomonas meleagridis]